MLQRVVTNRAWPKPLMGVSGLTAADHLIASLVMQARNTSTSPTPPLGDFSVKPEVFLKLRPAKPELDDDHKRLRSVL